MRNESGIHPAASARRERRDRTRRRRATAEPDVDDVAPLTLAQRRELRRRIKDAENRTRYLLASVLAPTFALYYSVSEDSYTLNDASRATLFKRRAAAAAIKEQLGSGVRLVRCRVDTRGQLVESSLPKPHTRAVRRSPSSTSRSARGRGRRA